MKFLFFVVCLMFVALGSTGTKSFEKRFGYKKVFLTIASGNEHFTLPVMFGLHHNGFRFKISSNTLTQDTSNFFKDATFVKTDINAKNEVIALLDYRLIDNCDFEIDEGGLYVSQNLVWTVKNHEKASADRVWILGIAPALRNKKFCSGLTLTSFSKKMVEVCKRRDGKLKTLRKDFSDTGDHYFRVTKLIEKLSQKVADLQKQSLNAKKEHNDILMKIKKSKVFLNLFNKDVSAAAGRYFKSKKILNELLAGNLNKGALIAQIEKQGVFAKGRYNAELRNLDVVKQRILELIPDALKLVNKAYFAADEGKHADILKRIRINP